MLVVELECCYLLKSNVAEHRFPVYLHIKSAEWIIRAELEQSPAGGRQPQKFMLT